MTSRPVTTASNSRAAARQSGFSVDERARARRFLGSGYDECEAGILVAATMTQTDTSCGVGPASGLATRTRSAPRPCVQAKLKRPC